MHTFIFADSEKAFLVQTKNRLEAEALQRLSWLLGVPLLSDEQLSGPWVGPRKEMVSPWSTNAVEIAANMGISGISRIESFSLVARGEEAGYDPMLEELYPHLDAQTLVINDVPEAIRLVADIAAYNQAAGLALAPSEIEYLKDCSRRWERPLTDSEIFAFAQVNSEHCRHKIFNGTFVIDGQEQPVSLFQLIKETSHQAPQHLVSAYKDNVALIKGPAVSEFRPTAVDQPALFAVQEIPTVITLKAETHNFPTTVEPFNGAATGSGGEIRDRMAGGRGSLPLAGTAVYMTAYPRLNSQPCLWESTFPKRHWKYQSPEQILIKASNGASDFGNKFGQPLICGSLLTFEGRCQIDRQEYLYAYDRTIMLAGGIGYAYERDALKEEPAAGQLLILLGGDNYRIGMAGGSVSSVATGIYGTEVELSAVQRANPEMQKRVFNVIRALVEHCTNPIRLVHDHGAGGHINCFAELMAGAGGCLDLDQLPLGDSTLSLRELLCNESQERMGLIIDPADLDFLRRIAARERAPLYVVGTISGDQRIICQNNAGEKPIDVETDFFFGSSPQTTVSDSAQRYSAAALNYKINSGQQLLAALKAVLSLEGVACKDWLTNKVDRSVTGRIALQQCCGPLQLPLNNVGVAALDYRGKAGIATTLGHAPAAAMISAAAGSRLSIAEALTNLIWAPLAGGLETVVLSANWMWPASQAGEDARLYAAVKAASDFACQLGLPIPTGKDSLSMTMNYPSGQVVRAPGTVVISAVAPCNNVKGCVTPDLKTVPDSVLLYVDLSGLSTQPLGGSSFAQSLGLLGTEAPDVTDVALFKGGFTIIQQLLKRGLLLAGHDISSGGLVTTLCEMAFGGDLGFAADLTEVAADSCALLFTEKPGLVLQVAAELHANVKAELAAVGLPVQTVGSVGGDQIAIQAGKLRFSIPIAELRRAWFKPSYLLDARQCRNNKAAERYRNLGKQPLSFVFPPDFTGRSEAPELNHQDEQPLAAVIREKGTNGDREMAWALYAAGFRVKDVTMTDLMAGAETLESIGLLVFPGGFSNSDVLGAARGWAGAFKYNDRARTALERFYARPNTLSLGVCNGCQLLTELKLICPEKKTHPFMLRNDSQKFESAFLTVDVAPSTAIMLQPLIGSRLGLWVAHGEGKFHFTEPERRYQIPLRYISAKYPANPNGSRYNAAAICSQDGRHLAMMPHLERSIYPWQWAYYPMNTSHQETPWLAAFRAARQWLLGQGY